MFWPSVGSFQWFWRQIRVEVWARSEAVLECSPSNTPEQLKKVGGIRWWEMIWNHGEPNGILMEFSCNLVVSMDSHDERHNWDWKAKKGWDMHRVGNTTKNGYRIWKLRTNMHQVRYFFSNWQKTLQKTWININQTTFVWRGISWKAKIAWASDRLKNCVAGVRFATTPVVARYHPDKRPWSAGGYGEKAHENLGRFGLLDIGAYDLGSRISGLLRLSGIVPFCGRWLSPWTRLARYVPDLVDTVASSRMFLFLASLEQCQDDTQQPWIYLEKLTWVMNKPPGCLGYIWYIGDEKLTSYVGITIKHYKDPYETTSISVFNGKYPARFFFVAPNIRLNLGGQMTPILADIFFFKLKLLCVPFW